MAVELTRRTTIGAMCGALTALASSRASAEMADLPARFYLNGAGDAHSRMQALLDKAAGRTAEFTSSLVEGIDRTLVVRSGTTVLGLAGGTVIKAAPGLQPNAPMIQNDHAAGVQNARPDSDIDMRRLVFDGSGLSGRVAPLVSLAKIERAYLNGVRIQNVGYIGLGVVGCRDCVIERLAAVRTGDPHVSREGGPAIFIGRAGDGTRSDNIIVRDMTARDLEWAAAYVTDAGGVVFERPVVERAHESGIFANSSVSKLVIKDARIDAVKRKYISSSALEIGAQDVEILGGDLSNTDAGCIALQNVGRWQIDGTTVANARRDPTYAAYATAGLIDLIDNQALEGRLGPGQVSRVTFAGDGKPYAAIAFDAPNGSAPRLLSEIRIEDNIGMASQAWVGGSDIAFVFAGANTAGAATWGPTCVRRRNAQTADDGPVKGHIDVIRGLSSQDIVVGYRPSFIRIVATEPSAGGHSFEGEGTAADGFQGFERFPDGRRQMTPSRTIRIGDGTGKLRYEADLAVGWHGFKLTARQNGVQPSIDWLVLP